MRTFSASTQGIVAGTILSPLAVIPASLILFVVASIFSSNSNSNYFDGIQFFFLMTLLISYPLMLFVGAPLAFVLKRYALLSFKLVLLVSVVLSSFMSVTIFSPSINIWLLSLFYSTSVVACFWFVYRWVDNGK